MRTEHTLMIVDDNRTVRETYRDLFEAEDFAVVEAGNGAVALLWLHTGRADLILLDLEMPIMDGRSFLEYRLVHPHIREIPVLVIGSRIEDPQLHQSLLKLGAVRMIQKPAHLRDLVGAVRDTLASPRASEFHAPVEALAESGRQDARVVFTVSIRVRTASFAETSGRLRDLSAGGLGAYLPTRLSQGETITVRLDIEGGSLALTGLVQWAGGSLTTMGYPHGIRFTERQKNTFPLYIPIHSFGNIRNSSIRLLPFPVSCPAPRRLSRETRLENAIRSWL